MNDDIFLPYTKLNKNLVDYILNDLPKEYNNIEIAIYFYIKLSKTLSYNNEYYIFDGDAIVAKKHENINAIKNIDLINNEIVCYEFTAIYAKLLDLFNIKFLVKYKKRLSKFGGQHTNLTFETNNFYIYADAVTSILDGDLFRAKIGYDLVGMQCRNDNINLKQDFYGILNDVYNKLVIYNYNDLLSQCRNATKNFDIEDKIIYFSNFANSFFKNAIDCLALMLFLRKNILSLNEFNNCNMLIIKNNCVNNYQAYADQLAFPTMIVEFINKGKKIYYTYIPGCRARKISQENLSNLFKLKKFEYKVDNPKRLELIYK